MKLRTFTLFTLSMLLVSCAALKPDAVVDPLTSLPLPREHDAYPDASWFAEPLTAPRVVQSALANHPEVRAELSWLDAADAERLQTGLLRNPMLSLMTLAPEGSGSIAIEAGWMQSLYDLLTRRQRIGLADAQWRRQRAETVQRLLDLAWSAQSAYYDAIAAVQRQQLLRDEVAIDAQLLALRSRLAERGLVTQTELLQTQADLDERRYMLHEAEAEQIDARSMLAEKLGLPSRAGLNLPVTWSRPNIPEVDMADWSTQAFSQRADLQASVAAVDIAQRQRTLDTGKLRATEPEIGAQLERDVEGMAMIGPALRIALPMFDNGDARSKRADALVREAWHRAEAQRRAVLLSVERAAALLFVAKSAADDAVRHRDRVQSADVLSAAQRRNGSIDLFSRVESQRELIAVKRQVVDAELALMQAHVTLQRALGGGFGPSDF